MIAFLNWEPPDRLESLINVEERGKYSMGKERQREIEREPGIDPQWICDISCVIGFLGIIAQKEQMFTKLFLGIKDFLIFVKETASTFSSKTRLPRTI